LERRVSTLQVRHRTTYLYRTPVTLSPHRMMLRPKEGPELRLVRHELVLHPQATITWAQDVAGNAVASATFTNATDRLQIDSHATVELSAAAWPIFPIEPFACSYPFRYPQDEWIDLGALVVPQYSDPARRLQAWAYGFVRSYPTDTLSLLKDLCTGISRQFGYQSRDDEGTQSPTETLARGWGSCRDFAVLFAEAARTLGFGARIVSGYLYDRHRSLVGSEGTGSTHAWAEVYVPGAGWIAFDPTNRNVGGSNLIPVAIARGIEQATPVVGSFLGKRSDLLSLRVEVAIAG
jgi:transglutaminase-like putative cysteine protease